MDAVLRLVVLLAAEAAASPSVERHDRAIRSVVRKESHPSLLEVEADAVQASSEPFDSEIQAVAFSPNNKEVATGSADNATTIWDADSGLPLRTFYYHAAKVHHLTYSPDAEMILSGAKDGRAAIWNPQTRAVEREFNESGPIECAGFSRSGMYIITGSDNKLAKVWDTRNSNLMCTLNGHDKAVQAVAMSPEGGTALTGSDDYTAKIWRVDECIAAQGGDGELLQTLVGHTGSVNSVAFSPFGKWVVTASQDFTARIWEHKTGKPLRIFGQECDASTTCQHMGPVMSVAWKPPPNDAQKWLPEHDQVLTGGQDGTVKLWMAHTGKLVHTFTHGGKVNSVGFAPDGKRIISGSSDGTAKIWSLTNNKELTVVRGNQIQPVKLTRNGNAVVYDKSVSAAARASVEYSRADLIAHPWLIAHIRSALG